MLRVKRHSKNNKLSWDSFVNNANNGTKIELKGGQNHKIGLIEDNNHVRVP